MSPWVRRSFAFLLAGTALGSSLAGADASPTITDLSTAAAATAQAEPVLSASDIVSIYNQGNVLNPDVQNRVVAAADSVGAASALGRDVSVAMDRVMRGSTVVQQPSSGFHIPMAVDVLPLAAVGPLFGKGVASVLAQGSVIMSKASAGLRGAEVGDTVDIETVNGGVVTMTIGLIPDDAVIGGSEILMGPAQADSIGATMIGRVVVWGINSRDAFNQALVAYGVPRAGVRIRRSWDPFDPDSTIGMASTKAQLGEFAYRVNSDGSITQDAAWPAAYLPANREVLVADIPIRARCNNTIKADLIAALDEVDAAGLSGAIDVPNANAFGGCYFPRFSRLAGTLGFLSRHSWGQALDTNTVENPQGGVPKMNCDVVRIFRKHNFAWGGNFLLSDGMHFEWVGTRRDQYQYPSPYCPNLPVPAGTTFAAGSDGTSGSHVGSDADSIAEPSRATIFADDGLAGD